MTVRITLAFLLLVTCCNSVGQAWNQCQAGEAQCKDDVERAQIKIHQVERRSKLPLNKYIREYEAKYLPVVITDYSRHIIDREGASMKQIKRLCGKKKFTPHVYNPNSTAWAKMDKMEEMTVKEFLKYYVQEVKSPSSSNPLYMLDWTLLNNCPELGETITIPKYVVRDAQKLLLSEHKMLYDLSDTPWPSLFMSPSTLHGSGLHVDGGNSSFWMYLAYGRKRWRIVGAEHVKHLGLQVLAEQTTPYLEADLFEPDFLRFPGLAEANIWEADLRPGDLIIVPSGCAHQVQNLAPSIAIAGNYVSPHGMKHHHEFLKRLLLQKVGDEESWPEDVRRSVQMYGEKSFFKAVNSVFPETDLSFDVFHSGFTVPGW